MIHQVLRDQDAGQRRDRKSGAIGNQGGTVEVRSAPEPALAQNEDIGAVPTPAQASPKCRKLAVAIGDRHDGENPI